MKGDALACVAYGEKETYAIHTWDAAEYDGGTPSLRQAWNVSSSHRTGCITMKVDLFTSLTLTVKVGSTRIWNWDSTRETSSEGKRLPPTYSAICQGGCALGVGVDARRESKIQIAATISGKGTRQNGTKRRGGGVSSSVSMCPAS